MAGEIESQRAAEVLLMPCHGIASRLRGGGSDDLRSRDLMRRDHFKIESYAMAIPFDARMIRRLDLREAEIVHEVVVRVNHC